MLLIQPTSLKPAGALRNSANANTNEQNAQSYTLKGSHRKNIQQSIRHVHVSEPIKIQTTVSMAQGRSSTPTPLINPATSPTGHVTAFCTTHCLHFIL